MSHSAMPPYFTWVVDKVLAVSALPYHHTHLNYLTNNGIQTVVSVIDETFRVPFHTNPKLKVVNLNTNLTVADCQNFVSLMERAKARGEGVLVHSIKGLDSAAVLAACYLVKLWECPADHVIEQLRVMRPTLLKVCDHENLVNQYHSQVANTFRNYYTDTNMPKWGNKTASLGSSKESYIDQPIPESYQERNCNQEYECVPQQYDYSQTVPAEYRELAKQGIQQTYKQTRFE